MRHEESYEEEWKDEAPLLSSLSKKTEPDVPEGYFDDLPSKVLDRIRMQEADGEEDDWKVEAPLLAALEKEMDVDVPEGYFEGLAARVLAQVAREAEEKPEIPVQQLRRKPRHVLMVFRRRQFWGMAAGIALLAIIGAYFMTRPDVYNEVVTAETEAKVQLAALDAGEITPYLDVSELSDEQLFQALGSEAEAAFDAEDHAVGHDEAIEYLKDVDLDAIDLQDLDIDLEDLQ
jgi:hypothetical protein